MAKNTNRKLFKTSMFLYIVCLLLPAAATEYGAVWGVYLLLLDMLGVILILIDIVQFEFYLITTYPSSLANLLYIISLLLAFNKRSYSLSFILSILALLSMTTFIFNPSVPLGMDWSSTISTPQIGYYTWLLSAAFLVYANYQIIKNNVKSE